MSASQEITGMYRLKVVEPVLRKVGFEDEADVVGWVQNLANDPYYPVGYEHHLADARRMATAWNLPTGIKTRYREAYDELRTAHEAILGDMVEQTGKLILRAPGALCLVHYEGEEAHTEPVTGLRVEPRRKNPYNEARLRVTYQGGDIVPRKHNEVICDPTRLPALIAAPLIGYLAQEAERQEDTI